MKTDKNFKLPKSIKRMLSSIEDKEQKRLWKDAFIWSESTKGERMTMMYDVSPSGKMPRKVTEKQNANG
jgi:hypothetical protein